jgi:hypothetical protein
MIIFRSSSVSTVAEAGQATFAALDPFVAQR